MAIRFVDKITLAMGAGLSKAPYGAQRHPDIRAIHWTAQPLVAALRQTGLWGSQTAQVKAPLRFDFPVCYKTG
jgi:hypothetical protein